jgi:DNA-binding NtrC family response regulator
MGACSVARAGAPYHSALAAFRRGLVEEALISSGGNRSRAAAALDIQRTYLLRLIRELRIDVPPTKKYPE